jgi:hypothetical protein
LVQHLHLPLPAFMGFLGATLFSDLVIWGGGEEKKQMSGAVWSPVLLL